MQALLAILMVPLTLINFFGGIASGIWLAILGEWWAIGYGLVGLIFSHFLIGLALMPSMLFVAPASLLLDKGHVVLALPLVFLSQLYTYTLIIAWCLFVFYIFMSNANSQTMWPLLIWSYGVALGPWMYLAQKDQQAGTGDASIMTTFFAEIAYIVMAIVALLRESTLFELGTVFALIMILGLLIQTVLALAMLREQRRFGNLSI